MMTRKSARQKPRPFAAFPGPFPLLFAACGCSPSSGGPGVGRLGATPWPAHCYLDAPFKMILGKVWDEPPKLPIIHGELGLSLGPVPSTSTAFFTMSPGRLGATPRPAHLKWFRAKYGMNPLVSLA